MSESPSNPQEQTPRQESSFARLFKGFVRLILVILGGAAIGLIAYLAYLFIFRDLVQQPSTQLQEAFSIAETRQALMQQRYDTKLSEYNERISVLESQHTLDEETLSELQSNLQAVQTAVAGQTVLLDRISALEDEVQQLFSQATQTSEQVQANLDEIGKLAATIEAQPSKQAGILPLLQEIRVLHALELLDRARLLLLQNNLGLASQDIQQARDILVMAQGDASPTDEPILADWIDRLQGIADDLPQTPRLASIDLETVWEMMSQGLQGNSSQATLTPLQLETQATPETESTPEPTPSTTPTP